MSDAYDASLSAAERKRHGVFYTPEPVVRYLLRATAPRGPVADLSCGDGAFLAEAARAGHPVMGIDRDPDALARAESRLRAIVTPPCPIGGVGTGGQGSPLRPASEDGGRKTDFFLHCGDGLLPRLPHMPDVVLGNPPYLEAKKTDAALKAHCRRLFPGIARGGFDVFVCFLQAGLDVLPPGGRLGYIVPNKFLVAEYARPLREALLAHATIDELIDVSDLPTFRDAAVYPVMLVLTKTPPSADHRVRVGQVTDLAQLDTGNFARGTMAQARWCQTSHRVFWLPPSVPTAAGLVDRLMTDADATPLSDLLTLRWAVSFHRVGLRDRFIFPDPTGRCPQRLLGGKKFQGNTDVRRYRTAWSGWWIDYDEERAKAEGNPLPPLRLFAGPKLLIAQNARRIIATLDSEEFVCKDTFIVGQSTVTAPPLAYLLGLLNSTLLSYLYGVLFKATHVNGAYLHYLACYLGDLPIRLADDPAPITALAQRLLDPALSDDDRRALDCQLDALVYDLYALSPAERALVTAAVPYAWGEVGKPGRRRK